jgi:Xaa-Pro aminopeptidase
MRYSKITPELFIRNRSRLVNRLKPNSLAIIHSSDEMPRNGDQTFPFRQNADLFYLTGLDQEKSILMLFPNHPLEANREMVFVVKTNDLMVTWYGHKYTLEQAREISGIKTIKWLDDFDAILKDLILRAECVYLNQNENTRFFTDVPSRDLRFAQKLRQDYPLIAFKRVAPLISELRTMKEPEEIAMMQKACDITGKAFRRVLGFTRPGVMEYEIEAEVIHEFIRNGASGHSYSPIIASGANACILHYNENDRPCNDGDLILFDFGAEYGNYAADLSRTIPANGKFTPRQRQVYDALLRVMRKAIKLLVPETTIDKWHAEVCLIMEKELIGLGLFTEEDVKNQDPASPMFFKYYMHGTGHFLGLDVHDVGSKQQLLQHGMVITCEPGIYIQEEGIGIRLENDIMVADEPVDLMAGIPLDPDEIERLMARGNKLAD